MVETWEELFLVHMVSDLLCLSVLGHRLDALLSCAAIITGLQLSPAAMELMRTLLLLEDRLMGAMEFQLGEPWGLMAALEPALFRWTVDKLELLQGWMQRLMTAEEWKPVTAPQGCARCPNPTSLCQKTCLCPLKPAPGPIPPWLSENQRTRHTCKGILLIGYVSCTSAITVAHVPLEVMTIAKRHHL